MGKTKQITLNLTEEQQSILRMALIDTRNTVSRLFNYEYDNDDFYNDLIKQVYHSTMPSNGYSVNDKNYKPWVKSESNEM